MEEKSKFLVLILSLIGDLRKVMKSVCVYNLTNIYCLMGIYLVIMLGTL